MVNVPSNEPLRRGVFRNVDHIPGIIQGHPRNASVKTILMAPFSLPDLLFPNNHVCPVLSAD